LGGATIRGREKYLSLGPDGPRFETRIEIRPRLKAFGRKKGKVTGDCQSGRLRGDLMG